MELAKDILQDCIGLAAVSHIRVWWPRISNSTALVQDSNGTDEFAEILEIRVGKDAIEETGALDKNVR